MAPAHNQRSAHGATTIKQEPVETDPLPSPNQEVEDVFIERETVFLREWGSLNGEPGPLSIKKEEHDAEEENAALCSEGHTKTEQFLHDWHTPDGMDSARDPLSIEQDDCSPSENFPGPSSTLNIEKAEEEDEGGALSEDDGEHLEDQEELTSSGSEPESVGVSTEGIDGNDDLLHETSGEDKSDSVHVGHKCANFNEASAGLDELKERTYEGSPGFVCSCSICHKTFRRVCDFKRHLRTHGRPDSCSICNKTFVTSGYLKKHSLLHIGNRPYLCSICNKTFATGAYLRRHSRLHTGDRTYTCTVCNKAFSTSRYLKKHSQTHAGSRSYTCDVCNKIFRTRYYLNIHTRLHTSDRAYSCSVCNKTFSTSYYLKIHSLLHTGESPYSCDICNKTFITSHSLKKHSLLHTAEQTYSCHVCNKTFSKSRYLKSHLCVHIAK